MASKYKRNFEVWTNSFQVMSRAVSSDRQTRHIAAGRSATNLLKNNIKLLFLSGLINVG